MVEQRVVNANAIPFYWQAGKLTEGIDILLSLEKQTRTVSQYNCIEVYSNFC